MKSRSMAAENPLETRALPLVEHLVLEPSYSGEESKRLGTHLEWPKLFSFVFCFVLFGLVAHNSAANRGIVVAASFLVL